MPNVGRKAPDKEHTQSVCFYKEKWTKESSKKWCKDHDYYVDGLDETDTLYRYRQYDPDDNKFRYRNQVIEKDSIFLVIGYPKEKKNMEPIKELRFLPFENFEIREDDGLPKLVGYASLFNVEAIIYGLWREKVSPGAYKKTIKENDIRALWNHNTDLPLGRNRSDPPTLTLQEDDKGLKVEIIPPDTQAGRDAVTSIKRGDVTQMSIAFQIIKQEWLEPEDKTILPLRTLRELKLFEVSPVTFPAFEATSISARSIMEPESKNEIREEALRLAFEADHGIELTIEQRETISAAMETYQPYLLEPEPEGHHSSEHETEPEQDHWEPQPDSHYSAEERERRLKELSNQIYPNSQGDNHEHS
jgi:HK97 family phage prohead protease